MDLSNLIPGGLAAAAKGLVDDRLGGVLDSFEGAFDSFDNRSLRLQWQAGLDGLDRVVQPQRVHVTEGICEGVTARITCLTTKTSVPWSTFRGLPIALQIVGPVSTRTFSLIVDDVTQKQSDGARTVVRITGRDVMTYMNRRRRLETFRGKTAAQVVMERLQSWKDDPSLGPCFEVTWLGVDMSAFPVHELIVQHSEETDGAFVRRLLRSLGVASFWRTKPATDPRAVPQQELVLFNDSTALPFNDTPSMLGHQRSGDPTIPEVIDEMSRTWRVVPAEFELRTWDDKIAAIRAAVGLSGVDQGQNGNDVGQAISEVRVVDPEFAATQADLDRLAQIQSDHHAFREQCFNGRGSVRSMAAGTRYTVSNCRLFDGDGLDALLGDVQSPGLVAVRVEHSADSNLAKSLDAATQYLPSDDDIPTWARPDDHAAGTRYAHLTSSVLEGTPIVPSYLPERDIPPLSPLVGTIVVPDSCDSELFTDDMSRALVRLEGGEPGADVTVPLSHMLPHHGAGHGLVMHLRAGTRVRIEFDGPDRPFIAGILPTGATPTVQPSRMPGLPGNRALTLWLARELDALRQQFLMFDDTTGQISAHFWTEAGNTFLKIGELMTERVDGDAQPRGNGFDLNTQHHGAIRTAMRLLISAWGTAGGSGTQLEADGHEQVAQTSLDLASALGQYAEQHLGLKLDTAPLAALLAATIAKPDFDEPSKAGEPTVIVTAPVGVATTTPKTIAQLAGENIDNVAHQHLNLTAGQQFNVNAGQGIGLFAHHGGLRATAHNGDLVLQSQVGNTRVESASNITLVAQNELTLMARNIKIISDGAAITLADLLTFMSKGQIVSKGTAFPHSGPDSLALEKPSFGSGNVDQRFVLRAAGLDGPIAADTPYSITLTDGSAVEGVSDAQGRTDLLQRDAMRIADIRLHQKDE